MLAFRQSCAWPRRNVALLITVFFAILCMLAGCSKEPTTLLSADEHVQFTDQDGCVVGDVEGPPMSRMNLTSFTPCSNGNYRAASKGTLHLGVAIVTMTGATFFGWVDNDFIEGHLLTNEGANVRDLYREMSYGELDFTYDIFDPVHLDMTWNGCSPTTHSCMAAESLLARGVDLDDYDLFVWALPNPTGCGGGAGGYYVPSTRSAVSYSAGTPSVYAHEIGHGINWGHAYRNGQTYGDGSCIMGKFNEGVPDVWLRHANAPHKDMAGWLSDDDLITVDEVINHGEIALAPLTAGPGGIEMVLKVPAASGLGTYYFSYRIDEDYDSGLAYADPDDGLSYIDGLTVHYVANGSTATDFKAILDDEEPWTAPTDQFTVVQEGVSDQEITFRFHVDSEHGLALAPETLVHTPFRFGPWFNLTLTNLIDFDISVTVSVETSDEDLTFTVQSPVTIPANDHVTKSLSPVFATTPSDGVYTFTVTTTDPLDPSAFEAVAEGEIQIDGTAPSKPAGLSAYAPHQWVDLSWNASSDNLSGVDHYDIKRGTSIVGTSSTTSYTDITTSANTMYTFYVRAVDVAGNQSVWSNGYKVTTGDELIIGMP